MRRNACRAQRATTRQLGNERGDTLRRHLEAVDRHEGGDEEERAKKRARLNQDLEREEEAEVLRKLKEIGEAAEEAARTAATSSKPEKKPEKKAKKPMPVMKTVKTAAKPMKAAANGKAKATKKAR